MNAMLSFLAHFGHYAGAFLAISLSAIGATLGQGMSFSGAAQALARQQESVKVIRQLQFLGLLLIESGPALGLIFVIIFLFGSSLPATLPIGLVKASIGLSFGLSSLFSGIAAGQAVNAAAHASARQPFIGKKLSTIMLLLESFAEVSTIFSFIIGLIAFSKLSPDLTLQEGIKLSAACLTLSVATIGTGIAQAALARSNISAIGLNPYMYGKISTFTFITSAFIETPIFFAFFLSFKLFYTSTAHLSAIECLSFYAITLASGLGSAGPAISATLVSSKSAIQAALNPSQYEKLRKTTIFAQFLLESGAIYSLLLSIIISMIL
ncbi:ATP synthase F0 subunit C [Candidatus Dependentiae bacterium]|nr:ATP synthase F0 subunit C [Candidatus Dependentiae bacterium]